MEEKLLSSKSVAAILNVNESSVKRWADSNKIKCVKTPGGHRKFRLSDIYDFSVKNNISNEGYHNVFDSEPEHLVSSIDNRETNKVSKYFFSIMLQANSTSIHEFISKLLISGYSLVEIFDNILQPAMVSIGQLWADGKLTIEEEHLASSALFDALVHLQINNFKQTKRNLNATIAVIENDYHVIPTKCLSILLENEGWSVSFLGANTPLQSILNFTETNRPELLLLSSTIPAEDPVSRAENVKEIKRNMDKWNGELILGGNGFLSQKSFYSFNNNWGTNFQNTLTFISQRFH